MKYFVSVHFSNDLLLLETVSEADLCTDKVIFARENVGYFQGNSDEIRVSVVLMLNLKSEKETKMLRTTQGERTKGNAKI